MIFSLNASCTVTMIVDGRIYVCGHPVRFRSGAVADGARARADDAQFGPRFDENRNVGGTIGAFDQDRVTGVMGHLGTAPGLIPIDMTVVTAAGISIGPSEWSPIPRFRRS